MKKNSFLCTVTNLIVVIASLVIVIFPGLGIPIATAFTVAV